MRKRELGVFILAVLLPAVLSGAIFTVTNTNDSGSGSLRQAILSANATPGADTINLNIGSGPQTIAPLSALPTIADPVTIDGRTQPGFTGTPLIELSGASAGLGANGLHITAGSGIVRHIVINRFQPLFLGGGGNGIVLETGGGNLVSGCFIGTDASGSVAAGNGANGILISRSLSNLIAGADIDAGNVISGNATGVRIEGIGSNGNRIGGNRIGTDLTGTQDVGNSGDGVVILAGIGNRIAFASPLGGIQLISGNNRSGVVIGGTATRTVVEGNIIGTDINRVADLGNSFNGVEVSGVSENEISGNLISGNDLNGVALLSGATGNRVVANIIGLTGSATSRLGNSANGVIVSAANDNTIGGTTIAARNIISGNGTNGVRLRSGAAGNVVRGNYIGTDFDGTADLGNADDGVEINDGAVNNTVGGATPAERNVISGNDGAGVLITDPTVTGNIVRGNFIGTNATGTAAVPNSRHGVWITNSASNNSIGGTMTGAGNVIAFNLGDGIFVESGVGNAILGNSIFSNAGLGIDLAPDGVTPNDTGDGDTGPNNLQNFPVLTQATSLAGVTEVQGSLNSAANTAFTLQFFFSSACDPSGHGEGQTFLGSTPVTTDGAGNASFTASLPAATGGFVTGTATDPGNNTSEFSQCFPVVAQPTPTPTPTTTPTPTATAIGPTPTATPVPGIPSTIPTLSPRILALLAIALAGIGFFLLRKNL